MRSIRIAAIVLALHWGDADPVHAQAERFAVEFTANYWLLSPSGNAQSNGTRADMRSDLGIRGWKSHGMFKVVVQTAPKHRLMFEAIPYRLKGRNTVTRSFEFGHRTFPVQDTIDSEASINYLSGGYQYDAVSTEKGHAGINVGVAYFGAKASAASQTFGSGTEQRKIALPLIGGAFRVFPLPQRDVFNINGEVKGMTLGSYGRYIHANVNAGFGVSSYVRLQAGLNLVDADVHKKDRSQGFKVRFAGPVFSVQFHD